MVRFLHTADWQMGMKATDASALGRQLREARFATLRRVAVLAKERSCDFVLAAGDLFEHNQVSPETVTRTLQIFGDIAPIPVYMLPGNHDWYDAGSVYRRDIFRSYENIVVLGRRAPVAIGANCMLYPCPVFRRWEMDEPTGWIPVREDEEEIRIGVAHGSLMPLAEPDPVLPVPEDVVTRKSLDYLALGHYHSLRRVADDRVAYPGTPEPTRFGEADAGWVLEVELQGPGQPPRITPHRVGRLRWLEWREELEGNVCEVIGDLDRRISALEDPDHTLLRLTLTGSVNADELVILEDFRNRLDARRENRSILFTQLREEVMTTESLDGALHRAAMEDDVLAGVIADLTALGSLHASAGPVEDPRDPESLLEDVRPLEGCGVGTEALAQEALTRLARIIAEVM